MRSDIERRHGDLKIGRHHFAFFRGSIDGLPLDELANRYMASPLGAPAAKALLDRVRQELIAAGVRHHRDTQITGASLSRLLRSNIEPLTPDERIALSDVPALEDFQAEIDPGGFYNESELIEEFAKRYGDLAPKAVIRKAERNERLRSRLRRAVDVLEDWIVVLPKPTDPIAIWLDPIVVAPLKAYGVITIDDLVSLINRRGNLWYRKVKGFGKIRAAKLIAWLQLNQVMPINELALQPYRKIVGILPSLRPKSSSIAPLEHLDLSLDLSGTLGLNRSSYRKIDADNDRDAIESWIAVKAKGNKNTVRAYRSQAERFLLWCVFEKGRALSSASPEDCAEYMAFLKAFGDPGQPWTWRLDRTHWVAPKGIKRWHPDWKPFTGDMTAASIRQAIVIVKGLFSYLARTRYLDYDPWTEIGTPVKQGKVLNIHHVLNCRQWDAVKEVIADMPAGEPQLRLRWMTYALYTTGLRAFELIKLTPANLIRDSNTAEWTLHVIGKRDRQRDIPVLPAVFGMLLDYMEARGHGRNPLEWDAQLPLVTSLGIEYQGVQKERDKPLQDRTLNQLMKSLFEAAADRLDDMIDASQLEMASTHWMRHTFVTEAIAAGAPVDAVQELAGHGDSKITAEYTHASEKRKRAAVELLAGKL